MHSNSCSGINLEFVLNSLSTYLRLFVVLYADDTVIFGVDETNYQKHLGTFYEYA